MNEIPKCSKCGSDANQFYIEEFQTYGRVKWDAEHQVLDVNSAKGEVQEVRIRCGNCGEEHDDIVLNWY